MENYNKTFQDYSELADLAIARGLEVPDKQTLVTVLKNISYYRFSGYLFPFKRTDSDDFQLNTSLSEVLERYTFDENLREITFKAFSKIEVQLRNDIIHEHAKKYGPFGYLGHQQLPNMPRCRHEELVAALAINKERSKEPFILSYNRKYTNKGLPLWMAIETLTFGQLLYVHSGLDRDIHKIIADKYCLPNKVLRSWIVSSGYIRNICAHHYRLWDRKLSLKPSRREKCPEWMKPFPVETSTFYAIALVLLHFQQNVQSVDWKKNFLNLAQEFPKIPFSDNMGFPPTWRELPMWTESILE